MAATVKLLPSGKEFTVASRETVLEAGLRSGLSLPYGCASGSCGQCRARIVSGRPRKLRFHDFVPGVADKAAGYVLLCCTGADSDLVVDLREVGGVDEIPYQEIQARASRMERVRDDVLVLRLRTPRTRALQFLSGQSVSLSLPGLPPRRCPIASCPCNGSQLEFHIRHVAGDAFCEHVFTRLKPSQAIQVSGPEGKLTFDKTSTRPVIFFAYDIGFAPVKSLVEFAISLESEQSMALYWTAPPDGGHYMGNLCRSWADALDNFTYIPLTSGEGCRTSERQRRDLSGVQRVLADHPDLSGHDAYFAGPQGLVSVARRLFTANGLPAKRFFAELPPYS